MNRRQLFLFACALSLLGTDRAQPASRTFRVGVLVNGGPGRVIASFQAVKHRLADMMVGVEQARSAVYWAACAIDEGSGEAPFAVHAAKAFACDTYSHCAGEMIQLHGGIGFTWEHDAHLYFKRARGDRTLLGTPDWHRERIARMAGLDEAA